MFEPAHSRSGLAFFAFERGISLPYDVYCITDGLDMSTRDTEAVTSGELHPGPSSQLVDRSNGSSKPEAELGGGRHVKSNVGRRRPTFHGNVPVVAAVCSVVGLVAVRLVQRSFKSLRARLEDRERQCEELTAACVASQAKIDELVKTLEEKTKELAEKERCLEQMRVEQQLSKSMAGMVERELRTTKKLLASYQGQLDQATYVLKENNRQNENANTPGAYGFTGGFWT